MRAQASEETPGRGEPRAAAPCAGVPPLVHLLLDAGSELIQETHAFVTAFASKRFRPTVAQSVSVAAYELLANGLSYGSVTEPVMFELFDAGPEIVVTNAAVESRIAVLSERVAALAADAEGIYTEELRRSMAGAGQRARLGLARVVHESKMSVSVEVTGQRIKVRARCSR